MEEEERLKRLPFIGAGEVKGRRSWARPWRRLRRLGETGTGVREKVGVEAVGGGGFVRTSHGRRGGWRRRLWSSRVAAMAAWAWLREEEERNGEERDGWLTAGPHA